MSDAGVPNESLTALLEVERVRDGEYRARLEDFWGGSLEADALARAALAAARTCEGMDLHSLHASLLRPAPPSAPVTLRVEPLDEGRITRRVIRMLGEGALCQVLASFATPDEGVAYQDVRPKPGLPDPESLPGTIEQARTEGWPGEDWWLLESSTEVAHAGRALARRSVYTRDGALLASVCHEALVGVT